MGLSKQQLRKLEKRIAAKNKKLAKGKLEPEAEPKADPKPKPKKPRGNKPEGD